MDSRRRFECVERSAELQIPFFYFFLSSILITELCNLLELPNGTKIKNIFPHGQSYWTRTAHIQTEQPDGSELSFFLKVRVISEKQFRPDH